MSRVMKHDDVKSPIALEGDSRIKIFYRWSSDGKRLLLLSALFQPSEAVISELRERWDRLLGSREDADIAHISVRSYPAASFVTMRTSGFESKRMPPRTSLSPEEAEILNSSRRISSEGTGFPLFINGRAGSGKSTILQYLFADYYVSWFRRLRETGAESRPLYFACSNDLVDIAHGVVHSLLTANHDMLLDGLQDANLHAAALNELTPSFRNFHRFLECLVPTWSERRIFPADKYVSYSRFRRSWSEPFGRDPHARSGYGPQVSWHVIRTYIKGLSVDHLMEGDDYEEMPREERPFPSALMNVFERVWNTWYRELCDRDGHWDDQDLARYLLDQKAVQPTYSAVFCDQGARLPQGARNRVVVQALPLLQPSPKTTGRAEGAVRFCR